MHGSPSLCTYNNMQVHGHEEGLAIFFLQEVETFKSVGGDGGEGREERVGEKSVEWKIDKDRQEG